jgi:hypothetical protein
MGDSCAQTTPAMGGSTVNWAVCIVDTVPEERIVWVLAHRS